MRSNKTLIKRSFVTGSIARSATHRYLSYSEADFEVFRPAGATHCTDGGEIWHGGGTFGPLLHAKFPPKFGMEEGTEGEIWHGGDLWSPPSCQISGKFTSVAEYCYELYACVQKTGSV